MVTLSQFIYGKFAHGAKDYGIVAHTSNLRGRNDLTTIAETYQFGNRSSSDQLGRAVGIFTHQSEVWLVATHSDIQPLVDHYGRSFLPYRYVLLPQTLLTDLKGQTFRLLAWLNQKSIPVFEQLEPNLSPLEYALSTASIEEATETVRSCLPITPSTAPSKLTMAVSALLNDRRLLITPDSEITPSKYLESLLLLMPVACRSKIAIALGAIHVQTCSWANLLIKLNNISDDINSSELFWLNESKQDLNSLSQQAAVKSSTSDYEQDFLDSVLRSPNHLTEFLSQLEVSSLTLSQIQNPISPEAVVNLTPTLPQLQQQQIITKYSLNWSIEQWSYSLQQMKNCPQMAQNFYQFCQQAVLLKAQSSSLDALKLAELIFNDSAFRLEDRFSLMDSALSGQSTSQEIKQTLIFLLPYYTELEFQIIQASNLYKRLQQTTTKITYSLELLLQKRESELSRLLDIVRLIGMSEAQQDEVFIEFLTKWVNSYEMVYVFFGRLVEQFLQPYQDLNAAGKQISAPPVHPNPNLLNSLKIFQTTLPKTFDWLQIHNADLVQAIIIPEQQEATWNAWYQLAQALYGKAEKELVTFLDRQVGQQFNINVWELWLPLIYRDHDLRKTVFAESTAWKYLQLKSLDQMVCTSPQYAATLLRCLRDSHKPDWVSGDLLRYLIQDRQQSQTIDTDLKDFILSPSVISQFSVQNWLILQQAVWQGIVIDLPLHDRPKLEIHEQDGLWSAALKAVENAPDLSKRKRILADCHAWGLALDRKKHLAKQVAASLTQPEQTHCFLRQDCSSFNLGFEDQREILQAVKAAACDLGLLLHYLGNPGQVIDLETNKDLVGRLLSLPPNSASDRAELASFSIRVIQISILPARLDLLCWWRTQLCESQKPIYMSSFETAVSQELIPRFPFPSLQEFVLQLKQSNLNEEALIVTNLCQKLLDSFS